MMVQSRTPRPQIGDINIALMGATGTGKTSFLNLLCGSDLPVGHGLRSCTSEIQGATVTIDKHQVSLIDTPGFDDTKLSDTDVLNIIAGHLQLAYERDQKLTGLVYMHKISDNRLGGIGYKNLQMFQKLCGDGVMSNVVLCTTRWDSVSPEEGQRFEAELLEDFWKPMINKGAHVMRHNRTLNSAQSIVGQLVERGTVKLRLQQELVEEKKTLLQTAAGEEINKEILAEKKKNEAKIEEMKKDHEQAFRDKEAATQAEIEKERLILEAKLEGAAEAQRNLARDWENQMSMLREQIRNTGDDGFRCTLM